MNKQFPLETRKLNADLSAARPIGTSAHTMWAGRDRSPDRLSRAVAGVGLNG
jgi:hypothetical protein